MTIKVKFKNLGVDAGNLSIIDSAKITSPQKFDPPIVFPVDLEPGRYRVKYKIPHSWLEEPQEGVEEINVPSGRVIVGDACYSFSNVGKSWSDYLEETDFLQDSPDESAIFMSTGGDGSFALNLEFTKVK